MHARFATRPPDVSARRVAASQALRVVTLGVAASAVLVGCGTPGVRGVAGTAPAPSVRWTPPAPSQPAAPLPAPPQLPPDLTGRIAQLKLTDVIDIALRNNTATSAAWADARDRKSTRLNSSHEWISYAVFCLKKKKKKNKSLESNHEWIPHHIIHIKQK